MSRTCEGGGIGDVLLGPSIEQVLADVEDEGRDQQHEDQAPGEEDQDLAGAGFAISC
jgi:hypothetical protein